MRPATGTVTFTIGIIVAVCGAAKLPAEGDRYPDTIQVAIFGLLIAIAGLEVWYGRLSQDRALENVADDNDTKSPTVLLGHIIASIDEFESQIESAEPESLTEHVDQLLTDYVLPFIDARQKVIDRLGIKSAAEILVTAAFAERMLNRAWSAAADGYLAEAQSAYDDSAAAFRQTEQLLSAST